MSVFACRELYRTIQGLVQPPPFPEVWVQRVVVLFPQLFQGPTAHRRLAQGGEGLQQLRLWHVHRVNLCTRVRVRVGVSVAMLI